MRAVRSRCILVEILTVKANPDGSTWQVWLQLFCCVWLSGLLHAVEHSCSFFKEDNEAASEGVMLNKWDALLAPCFMSGKWSQSFSKGVLAKKRRVYFYSRFISGTSFLPQKEEPECLQPPAEDISRRRLFITASLHYWRHEAETQLTWHEGQTPQIQQRSSRKVQLSLGELKEI